MAKKMVRYFIFLLGLLCVALGAIGALLPLLPTVPFMILALWCFACSSTRFHDWLYHHRIFGPQLQLWQQYNVIPLNAKRIAITSMALSLTYMIFITHTPWWLVAIAATVMAIGTGYILSKPSTPPTDALDKPAVSGLTSVNDI